MLVGCHKNIPEYCKNLVKLSHLKQLISGIELSVVTLHKNIKDGPKKVLKVECVPSMYIGLPPLTDAIPRDFLT